MILAGFRLKLLLSILFLAAGSIGVNAQNNFPVPSGGNGSVSHDTIFIPSSGYTTISDDGGPGGVSGNCTGTFPGTSANNYSNCGCISIVTVCPDVPGLPVTLEFKEFGFNTLFDSLTVYDSGTNGGGILYSNRSGGPQSGDNCNGPGIVTATNATGCITVLMRSSTVINDVGFLAELILPLDYDLQLSTLEPQETIIPGVQNVEVTVINKGILDVDSFRVDWTVNGTPQAPVTYNTLLAAGDTTPTIVVSNTYNATGGDDLSVWTTILGGNADDNNANDTINRSLCQGMTGAFTIDANSPASSSNFTTFQDAVDSMLFCGIAGPVTFNVVFGSGPYNEQVVIPEINGASSVNTITFNGNGDTLEFAPTSALRYVMKLDGADWVTVDSLYIRSTDASYGIGVLLANEADNNTFTRNTVNMSSVTNTSTANSACFAMSAEDDDPNDDGFTGNYNLFENNIAIGGYYSIHINGTSGNEVVGNIARNNTCIDFYGLAIIVDSGDSTIVDGNDISRPDVTNVANTFYGIYIDDCFSTMVMNNRIHDTHNRANSANHTAYGIYTTSTDAPVGRENVYFNNLVYNMNNISAQYGLYNSSSDGAHYFHNTISLDDASYTGSGLARAFYQTLLADNIIVKNNVFNITRGGTGTNTGIYLSTSTSIVNSNNNVIYVNGSGSNNVGYLSTSYPNLFAWQTATGQDMMSVAYNPAFAAAGSGDFTPTGGGINNIGDPVGVTTDILGNARSATAPDPGAFEFAGPLNDVGVTLIQNPTPITTATPQNVDVTIRNFGSNVVDSVRIVFAVNGVAQDSIWYNTALGVAADAGPITVGSFVPSSGDFLEVWTTLPNSATDAFAANDSASLALCIGLAGNYTIDANNPTGGTNFASFQEAIDSMASCGLAGAVTFDVVPGSGPYVEQPRIPEITGASSVNTITFVGHGDTISFAPPSGLKYVFTLDGADWVRLDSLIIVSTDATYGFGLSLNNNADHNIISNCIIDVSAVTSTTSTNSTALAITNSNTSPTSTGSGGRKNQIIGNELIGGYNGLTVFGSFTGEADSNVVRDNVIRDFYTSGIALEDVVGTLVEGNDISRGNRSSVGTFYGIDLDSGAEGNVFEKNTIHNTHGSASSLTGSIYGLYVSFADADDNFPNIFRNNILYDFNGDGTIYALYASGSDNQHFFHNTVSLDNEASTTGNATYGLYVSSSADSIAFFNNIISIKRGGSGTKYALYSSSSTVLGSDGNDYYLNSQGTGSQYYAYWGGDTYDTLANWQASNGAIYDQNSSDKNPRYNDPANGDFMPTSPLINNIGVATNTPDDFFGVARPAVGPDPGAIEFVPPPDDAGVVELLSPVAPISPGAYDVTLVFRNFGGFPISDVNLYVDIDDGSTVTSFGPIAYTGNVPLGGTDTVTITNFNFTSSNYTITAWTDQPNGVTDANTSNDTLVVGACLALPAGNYTIDSRVATGGGNYQSFADAVAALDCGVLGDVTFTVQYGSGPYNEQVTLAYIPGASDTATITFDGQNADSTVLSHDGSVRYATILITGTDYVTIENMTILATGSNGFGIQMNDLAEHINILDNHIDVSATTSGATGIVASASTTSNSAEGFNTNYVLIDGNTIIASDYGIRLEQDTDEYSIGNRITNNTIVDAVDAAVYTDDQDSLIVMNNTITTVNTNSDGLYHLDIQGYFEILNNTVYVSDWGMYLEDANQLYNHGRAKVINNIISSNGDYGVYMNDADSIDVYHNTFVGAPGLRINQGENLDVRNNIFGGVDGDYAFEEDDNADFVAIDYNVYFNESGFMIRFGSTSNDYATLFDWRAAFPAYNLNSLQGTPQFVDINTDLHIAAGLLAYDKGFNLGITSDIDGDARPLAPSTGYDIGADEYLPLDNDVSVEEILAPTGRFCGSLSDIVTVTLFNSGLQPQSNIPVEVVITGDINTTLSAVYPGPLASDDRVTFDVGNFNGSAGGNITVTAYTNLAGDQFTGNDTSVITVVIDSLPTPPVAVNDTACVGQSLNVGVVAGNFDEIEWYDAPSGGNLLAAGNTFSTGPLFATDTFYAQGINGASENVGRLAPTSTGTFITNTDGWGLNFETYDVVTIDSVTVYPGSSGGTLSIEIFDKNNGNVLVGAGPVQSIPAGGGTTPVQVFVGITLPPGFYNIGLEYTGLTLVRESSGINYPYNAPSGVLSIVEGALSFTSGSQSSYYWFYNWTISKPGCPSERVAVEAVISEPVSDAGMNDTICAGDAATLTAANGTGWNWSTGDTTQTINPTPASNNTYSLTITDAYGCTGTPDFVDVVVNVLPTANAGLDDTVCTGSTATLAATGGIAFEWSNGDLTAISTPTVTAQTTYTVTVTDANGCTDTDDVTVDVNPLPSGNAPADVDVCAGDPATLTATGGVNYQWSTGAGVPTITVGPASTTTYSVTTTDANGCSGVDSVTVNVNPLPTVSFTQIDTACINQAPITLVGNPAGGTFSGVGVVGGQFDPSITGLGTYNVTYTYTDGNNCANSITQSVVVDSFNCFTTVVNVDFAENINVYPNPFNSTVNIDLTSISSGNLTISMIDLLGQEVMMETVDMTVGNNRYTLDMDSRLSDGMYIIKLTHNDEVFQIRMLKSGN